MPLRNLAPGEEAAFEGAPCGYPILTTGFACLYAIVFVPALMATLAGATFTLTVGPVSIPLPAFVPFLAVVLVGELWRLAVHRSTLYVIARDRVLVLGGVFRVKLRKDVPRAAVEGVSLHRGDVVLETTRGPLPFTGIGPEYLDDVRVALGLPAEHAPVEPFRHIADKVLVAVVALLLLFAWVDGWYGWRQRVAFTSLEGRVAGAIGRAEAATDDGVGRPASKWGGGLSRFQAHLSEQRTVHEIRRHDFSRRAPDNPRQPFTEAAIDIELTLPWGPIFWGTPRVTVREAETGPTNAALLEQLRQVFAAEKIDAEWPR